MATSDEIRREIGALDEQMGALSDQLDANLISARMDLVVQANQWIQRTVASAVDQHAGTVQLLGKERVREFKQKVNEVF
jgi:hypothetical protein